MEKKLDAISSSVLANIIRELNSLSVSREDLVSILLTPKGDYVAVFYSSGGPEASDKEEQV